ncbi:MAG: hypothetical protein HY746_07320 [Elusimicrobia bacterium]|nr:hypothetical protein [Elusimicrobiota bacterium]
MQKIKGNPIKNKPADSRNHFGTYPVKLSVETTFKGYKIETTYRVLSEKETEIRRQDIIRTVVKSFKREKKDEPPVDEPKT